jgi:hypothetical protein
MSSRKRLFNVISKRKAEQLLNEDGWKEDLDARLILRTGRVMRHENGRVLHILHSLTSLFFQSAADFDIVLQRAQANSADMVGGHILVDRMSYGEDFPDHVDHLIQELGVALKLTTEQLDRSFESLSLVERKTEARGFEKCGRLPLFQMILAYVGETMRIRIDGEWFMRYVKEDDVWEPWLKDQQGRCCTPFGFLYDKYVDAEPVSLNGAALITVNYRSALLPP